MGAPTRLPPYPVRRAEDSDEDFAWRVENYEYQWEQLKKDLRLLPWMHLGILVALGLCCVGAAIACL